MVKKKPLDFTIHKTYSPKCHYNITSGYIHLPNMKEQLERRRKQGLLAKKIPEDWIDFEKLIESMTHEWFHKWLHENFGIGVTGQWDNIDKYITINYTIAYCISKLIVYDWNL